MKILILTWRDLTHPQAGGAETYTQNVAQHWANQGHNITLYTSSSPNQPHIEYHPHGYTIIRDGGKYTVYRKAKTWWNKTGHKHNYDLIIDMINTVPFKAHTWKKPSPENTQPRIVAFIHQTCEEIWNYNAPKPTNLLGRYILEPRWLKSYNNRPLLAVSQSTKDSLTENPASV